VISASGKAKEWALANLKRGMRVEIRTEVVTTPAIPFKPDFIIGAGPQLLASGRFVAEAEAANYSQSLMRARHPRTAIGRREDGRLILVTVDGRQPQKSVGMTIEELAKLMLELGCREALNLDGGGSTTMVIKNRIVNSPSDQIGERPVSDALLVFTR
jgi:exopolysaccharide biosynthesis protein